MDLDTFVPYDYVMYNVTYMAFITWALKNDHLEECAD